MAILLSRLGRFAYRRAIPVIVAWFVIAVGAVVGGLALGGTMQDSFAIPGTESQQAIDRLAAVFPQTAGASAQLVIHSDSGVIDADPLRADIEQVVSELSDDAGVQNAVSPFSEYAIESVSADHSTAIVQVQFDVPSEEVTPAMLDGVRATASTLEDSGLTVAYGGQVFQQVEFGITIVEGLGVLFAALVLVVTFGSLLAAGLPLLTALVALGGSMGAVLAAAAFTTVSTATPMLALMIGLAVGIDYALFIVSRHRKQLADGMDPEESAATAVATAGSSVVFAGLTVVIALVGLLIVGIPFLGLMGVAAALAVVLAMAAATTLLPAIFGLLGRRLTPKPRRRERRAAAAAAVTAKHVATRDVTAPAVPDDVKPPKKTLGERWVGLVLKAPIVAVLAVVGVLGTLAIPAFQLSLALPDGGSQAEGSTARTAYDTISDEFGPGRNGPLVLAIDITQTTDVMGDLKAIGDRVAQLDGVVAVSAGTPNPTVDTGVIQVIPATGPSDPKTADLVERIRALAPDLEAQYGTPIAVTGATAVAIDVSSRLDGALLPFGLVVVGLSILLLTMVFRSVVVPIKAALGYLLSVFASFGVVVAVFQWGWGAELLGAVPGPILSFMPILLMAILFGLAMDYEVFLVSGMREAHVHGATPRQAITRGFSGAARVVTAAALIMVFVFAAFVPEGAPVIKVIALGLAVGIAVDAFLVRMTLVPALMALFGKAAWYLPKWLDRILPNVDIEGEGLRTHLEDLTWARSRVEAGEAITLDGLVAGDRGDTVAPVTAAVPTGALALVSGDPTRRRLLAATVSGRLPARGGRAHVAGHPLPTEQSRVARLVSIAEFGGPDRAGVEVSFGELLEERLRLTGAWYQAFRAGRRARAWVARVKDALAGLDRPTAEVTAETPVSSLPQLERAVAVAALALSERTPVVILDTLDSFSDAADAADFLRVLDRLAPATTTLVVGSPDVHRARPDLSRSLLVFEPEGALR